MNTHFRNNIERITHYNRNQAPLFCCIADCWPSWNAIQRAVSHGYTCLYEYRDGTEGWQETGHSLEEAIPVRSQETPR